ncbi:hypothetical protein lerEdw1_000523 [Lerista edwardsae]|nr:hypothetical protein lerEdw1_000523 [Lerista edwardsae]
MFSVTTLFHIGTIMFSIHNHLLLQIFLGALSFVYFAKALSGSYLKSTITQIERRFDIPSSLVGLIDGSFEIGCVQTVAIIGPIFGFLLGSLCAMLYVDIGFVDMDFLPSLKSLFGNPVYSLYLCSSIIQFNSLIGMVTYKPKYIEQQFGQSSSKTNFVIGLINIPAVALGIFSGGLIMKKFRLNVLGAARLSLGSSFFGYLLLLSLFAMGCKNTDVAGLTVSYQGQKEVFRYEKTLISECNSGCQCSKNEWDPICGGNGITYVSACLAGCKMANGSGKNMMFYNCSCVEIAESSSRHSSAVAGPCQKGNECPKMFLYFLVISVITSYTLSIGGTPGYILLLRYIYLGLTIMLGTMSTFLSVAVLMVLKKRYITHNETIATGEEQETTTATNRKSNFVNSDHLIQTTYWPEKETRL